MTQANMTSLDLDTLTARVSAGESLSLDELRRLAESPDILQIGMLADAVRRRINKTTVSFVRVALVEIDKPISAEAVPDTAGEARLVGSPATLGVALANLASVKAVARLRAVSGFSWADVERWAGAEDGQAQVLARLRAAGLECLAEMPFDLADGFEDALAAMAEAGFEHVRLTVGKAATMDSRLPQFLRAARASERFPIVVAVAPLPLSLNPLRPTTGYDDVKAAALARLAMPQIPHVQVDWLRYGPKLAQVALTFGADDLDNVSPSEDAPHGQRRAPIEELRRNVESAGFTAVERDGRFLLRA